MNDTSLARTFLFIGLISSFVAVVVVLARRARRAFRDAARRLGLEEPRWDSGSLTGSLNGMDVYAQEIAGGRYSSPHMVIEVAFSPCELLLDLRRQSRAEERAVAAGEAVDLATGDADFDETWIVEGAPAERVRRLLKKRKLRERIQELAQLPEVRVTIEDGKVTLYRLGTDRVKGNLDEARIHLALDIARAAAVESEKPLPEAPAEVDPAAADYRTSPLRAQLDTSREKVQDLKEKRAARRLREARGTMALMHVGSFAIAALFALKKNIHPAEGLVLGAAGNLIATVVNLQRLKDLRASAPQVPVGPFPMGIIVASWVIFGAALAFLRLR
jgi:hypothetical protein